MNQIAIDFVKAHEGRTLTAYQDSTGKWTVGFGATGADIGKDTIWTDLQVENRLALDLAHAESAVRSMVANALSEQQMAALISFVFNVGAGSLAKSMLLEYVKQGDWMNAAKEFPRWDHAGEREIKGLLIRRLDEAALFLRGS